MKLIVAIAALSAWVTVAQTKIPRAHRPGDNGPAVKAEVDDPVAIAVDGSKTLYIVEKFNTIRRVDLKSGIITTVRPNRPLEAIISLALDTAGNLIADEFTVDRVCRINPATGSVTTVVGGKRGFSGDGGQSIDAALNDPQFVTTDTTNNVYIADTFNHRIRRVDSRTGIITTVATVGGPNSVAVDSNGNLLVSQLGNSPDPFRIFRVDAETGMNTTVAGLAKAGLTGDGGPALAAGLQSPSNLLLDPMGNLYVVDPVNDRVRRIDAKTQIITTIAGSTKGFGGDGGPATRAQLNNPSAIAMDSAGNLYISEFVNHRVRCVDAQTGIIRTVAGNGFPHHVHVVE